MRLLRIVCSGYPLFKESETIEFRSVDQALQIIKNAMLRIKKKVFFAQRSRVIPVIPLIFVSHEGITGITY